MSADHGRPAPEGPTSLYAHAARLHRATPDGPLPKSGRPYPGLIGSAPFGDRERALLAARLDRHFNGDGDAPGSGVEALHDALRPLRLTAFSARAVVGGRAARSPERARRTGQWLVRRGTALAPVLAGLVLLDEAGAEPADLPVLRTVGLLRACTPMAVRAIAAVPGAAADLVWLAERSERTGRRTAVRALCATQDAAARAWLSRMSVPAGRPGVAGTIALEIAEAVDLAGLLGAPDVDDELLDHSGRLLAALADPGYRADLLRYPGAVAALSAYAAHAARTRPTPERRTVHAALTEEVRSGHAAVLDWTEPAYSRTLSALLNAPESPLWRDRVPERDHDDGPPHSGHPVPAPRWGSTLALRVVDRGPLTLGEVEVRPLVDGRPVVAAAFDRGGPRTPEELLGRGGGLRAAAAPHEVALAVAPCDEQCCGALYVTVSRTGATVTWSGWRNPLGTAELPDVRFDAAHYDAVLDRAAADTAWEWPARTAARLLAEHLDAEPGVLARWNCSLARSDGSAADRGAVRVVVRYPRRTGPPGDGPWAQFAWETEVAADDDPVVRAGQLLDRLRTDDPTRFGTLIGGSRDCAAELGLPRTR